MSQDSKEWIKTRMASLRKQAGFSFNQDLFISILLCLISGKDKHLILTAPPDRLNDVSQMASQISRCVFGLSTVKMACHDQQTRADLVDTLFSSAREESEMPTETFQNSHNRKTRSNDFRLHPSSHSTQTIDSKTTDRSQTSTGQSNGSKYTIKASTMQGDEPLAHVTPISPVDFNLRKRERQPFMLPRHSSALSTPSAYAQSISQKESNYNRSNKSRWLEHEDMKRAHIISTATTKLAQTLIMQNLESADESTQALLLELIVTKELRLSNIRYNVPKPFFLLIAVLPQGYDRLSISSQLMDRFFVSHNFEEDTFLHLNVPLPSTISRNPSTRRVALMKHEEIKGLVEKTSKVYVHTSITRYVRDVVVGIRTHPRVKGGLTARCSQDLLTVTKSLATIFERDFLTPDLVTIAAEKVLSHRLHILQINTTDDQMEKEDMDFHTPANIVAEILRVIYVPV